MPFLIHLLKILVGFLKYPEIDTLSIEAGMSFEAEAVFLGNSLINFRTSFAEVFNRITSLNKVFLDKY